MTRDYKILTTYWFITGLTILLLNDFVLKELYGNWFTGKLSDFAGLFVFPLFWTALFPRHKNKIFWLTGLLFLYWKSPYSQPVIDNWNNLRFFSIHRVVDYLDLLALTVLPFAFYINNIKDKIYSFRISPLVPLIVSAFAFVSTSKGPQTCFFNYSGIYRVHHYSRDSLIQDLKSSKLNVSFTKYHSTKYDDEHCEIYNLNDSIRNLVVLINDFREYDNTVNISLGCWEYMNGTSLEYDDEETLEEHRIYVKEVFEEKVLRKIEKNVP